MHSPTSRPSTSRRSAAWQSAGAGRLQSKAEPTGVCYDDSLDRGLGWPTRAVSDTLSRLPPRRASRGACPSPPSTSVVHALLHAPSVLLTPRAADAFSAGRKPPYAGGMAPGARPADPPLEVPGCRVLQKQGGEVRRKEGCCVQLQLRIPPSLHRAQIWGEAVRAQEPPRVPCARTLSTAPDEFAKWDPFERDAAVQRTPHARVDAARLERSMLRGLQRSCRGVPKIRPWTFCTGRTRWLH